MLTLSELSDLIIIVSYPCSYTYSPTKFIILKTSYALLFSELIISAFRASIKYPVCFFPSCLKLMQDYFSTCFRKSGEFFSTPQRF